MSDFGELCPLFTTGVYNEVFLGTMTGTLLTTVTLNWWGSPQVDPTANVASFRFGRTIVITDAWIRRITTAPTATCYVMVGKRTGSATATQSFFGTWMFTTNITTFPEITRSWHAVALSTSMTLNTADMLDIAQANDAADEGSVNAHIMIKYREK